MITYMPRADDLKGTGKSRKRVPRAEISCHSQEVEVPAGALIVWIGSLSDQIGPCVAARLLVRSSYRS
jgi:hypothetical protein